jgi:hypothetical protein
MATWGNSQVEFDISVFLETEAMKNRKATSMHHYPLRDLQTGN